MQSIHSGLIIYQSMLSLTPIVYKYHLNYKMLPEKIEHSLIVTTIGFKILKDINPRTLKLELEIFLETTFDFINKINSSI